MKSISKILMFCLAISFIACSDDDSVADVNNNDNPTDAPKSNLTIKATTTFNPTSGRALAAANLDVDQFLINIRKIEFEYAEGSQPSSGSQDDSNDDDNDSNDDNDDISLTFDQLPVEIQDYILENHPNDPFCKAKEEDSSSDDPYKYEVELASGLELYFKADFTLYAQEQDDSPCNSGDGDNDGNSNDDSTSFGDDDEFELAGPFEINLLDDETTTIVNIEIPIGEYEEVEFKMDRSLNPNSVLFQKSIMITGTLNGMPMTFYHTFDEDFEVDYEDAGQNLIIDDTNNNEVTFNFDLNAVVSAVNFDAASDGNGDGTIEISPVDTDGNNALANQIKNAIVQFAELVD
ncbi:hypothetical protein [Flavobacteriaceae bacterium 14752]|uniref:hypothetical protein n=1 Tax=Mesohalobacter salilacus TaxID=2491711 RepID=UPI000F62CD93|nr:hypothetical protein EIG84_02820 [Flavobacteriaceae bacterium 14752]